MTLWLRVVVGTHLAFETTPSGLNDHKIESEIRKKLTELGIPNPWCDVNEGEDNDCGIAIGTRLEKIGTLYDYDHKHSSIPVLTAEQIAGIRQIAEDLLNEIKAAGYQGDCEITQGIAVHATS